MDLNSKLLDFIEHSPTAFHAAANIAAALTANGYHELLETEVWTVSPGDRVFIRRNGSSIIALRIPERPPVGFLLAAAHADSPSLRLKETAPLPPLDSYIRLNVEKYGGMLCAPWLDRPLSIAGRVAVRGGRGVELRLVDLVRPVALIPNLAIHMDRSANEGKSYEAHVDMLPLFSQAGGRSLDALLAESLGVREEDILSRELQLYPFGRGMLWGADEEFLSAPRLDDLQGVYGCLEGFLAAEGSASLTGLCVFDNEEVGNGTRQGADSTFLSDVLRRVCFALGMDESAYLRCVANSFLLSADNAHAVHPNHSEHADRADRPVLNGGVVLKYNANRHYTTDSVSAALFSELCGRIGVPVQRYTNRADIRGGWTLGHVSLSHVSLDTADIGLPQLAMHSCYETAGAKDTQYLMRVVRELFSRTLRKTPEGFSLL